MGDQNKCIRKAKQAKEVVLPCSWGFGALCCLCNRIWALPVNIAPGKDGCDGLGGPGKPSCVNEFGRAPGELRDLCRCACRKARLPL